MKKSEYKHALANILRSRYVARTPPVEARSPGRRSNVENAPLRRRPVTGQQCAQTPPSGRTMSSYRGMDASLQLGFALCCHSNATRTPIANPHNSAQQGGSLYHAPNLHSGPYSSVGVRPRTDRQTDTETRVTTIHFVSSTITQNVITNTNEKQTVSFLKLVLKQTTFTARRNACIASAVLATAIPSVCPSVCHTPVLCHNDGT